MNKELGDLRRNIEERNQNNSQLMRNKNSFQQTNEALRRALEEESKAKAALAHTLQVKLEKFVKFGTR